MRILSAALLFAAASTAAKAADWRIAATASETAAGRTFGFIDAETLQRAGNRATFWAFLVYERAGHGFDNTIVQFVADCANYAFESTRIFSYRGHRLVGTVGRPQRGRAAPNSAGFGLIETACGARPLDSARILDPYEFARRSARAIRER